MVKVI